MHRWRDAVWVTLAATGVALAAIDLEACSSGSSDDAPHQSSSTDGATPNDASGTADRGVASNDATADHDAGIDATADGPSEDAADGGDSRSEDAADGGDGTLEGSANDGAIADATVGDGSPDATVGDGSVEAESDGAIVCPPDGGIPDDLACTGLYSDWSTKTIASDVMPYTPALVFWSDGADKTRWIYLPAGTQIDTTDMDNWVFPSGTKIWKQFVVNGALVETRLIWKTSSALGDWTFLDYRWSADGSSATRLDSGETNVNGTTYEIPSTSVCAECHGGRPDVVLGFDLFGLGLSGAQGVTLTSLSQAHRFTASPPATVAVPEDATGKAATALGWLHVNCGSSCHNANGYASVSQLWMKLLWSQVKPPDGAAPSVADLDTYTTSVGVQAQDAFGGKSYLRIAPGDSAASLVPILDATRGTDAGFEQMPPIVSHIPDTTGVSEVMAWIDALGDAGVP